MCGDSLKPTVFQDSEPGLQPVSGLAWKIVPKTHAPFCIFSMVRFVTPSAERVQRVGGGRVRASSFMASRMQGLALREPVGAMYTTLGHRSSHTLLQLCESQALSFTSIPEADDPSRAAPLAFNLRNSAIPCQG